VVAERNVVPRERIRRGVAEHVIIVVIAIKLGFPDVTCTS